MRKILLLLLISTATTLHAAEQKDSTFTYRPNFHGTIRARGEYSTESHEYRFQVRNVRATLDGRIMPQIDYFLNADLCDMGKIKMLDAWVRFSDRHGFSVQGGQFRIPFGVDPFRAPHQYYFNNRSFIGKQLFNYRAVGAKLGYRLPGIPLNIEGGIFSPTAIGDHSPWQKKVAWAWEASYDIENVRISGGMASIRPSGFRANLAGGCVSWKYGRWIVEGEYMYERYVNREHRPAHAWNFFGAYRFPVKFGLFNFMSAEARFDGMTAHSDLSPFEDGKLGTNDPKRSRITAGIMISHYRSANLFADLRLDYEKYFYGKSITPTPDNGDKLSLELILRF